MPAVYTNQRRALRRAVKINCQVVRERDFKLVAEESVDLSRDGMQVLSRTRVLTGENVLVSFKIPGGDWVDAEATVERVVHGRRRADRGQSLGLAFHGLDAGTAEMLERTLRGVPPPFPGRG